jgi:hypothetical protein
VTPHRGCLERSRGEGEDGLMVLRCAHAKPRAGRGGRSPGSLGWTGSRPSVREHVRHVVVVALELDAIVDVDAGGGPLMKLAARGRAVGCSASRRSGQRDWTRGRRSTLSAEAVGRQVGGFLIGRFSSNSRTSLQLGNRSLTTVVMGLWSWLFGALARRSVR